MPETSTGTKGVQSETKTVLNLGVYMSRTSALGATRLYERMAKAGISRATQHRWLNGGSVPDMELARAVAHRLGVTLDELFVEVAA